MKAGTMPALFLVISQMSGRVLFSEYHEPRFGTQLTGRGYREGRLLLELKHHLVMKWREG